jgi:type II secretory pathway pseudopilin PulG
MTRRSGFMRIELTVVMATSAALMGIATALVFLFVRCVELARENLRVTAVRAGMTEQFRRDAHAARKAQAQWPNRHRTSAWRLDLAGGRALVYQARPGGLARTETVDAAVVAEEIYRLPGYASVWNDRLAGRPDRTAAVADCAVRGAAWRTGGPPHGDRRRLGPGRWGMRGGGGRSGWWRGP